MSILTVSGLSAGYHKMTVIEAMDFTVESGKIVGILGANGCGKTTLLKAILGLLPHEGLCKIGEKSLSEMSQKELANNCGYIPQKSGISIDLSILDVVLMGFNPKLGLLQTPTKAMREDALAAMAQVGLLSSDNPGLNPETSFLELSEGQKQLCILARTFVGKPRLLLLDEPESALDFRMRHNALELLRDYSSETGAGVLISLHDSSLALNFCDELLILSNKRLIGCIHPKDDTIESMEKSLSLVYGQVSLHKLKNNEGKEILVMLKEA